MRIWHNDAVVCGVCVTEWRAGEVSVWCGAVYLQDTGGGELPGLGPYHLLIVAQVARTRPLLLGWRRAFDPPVQALRDLLELFLGDLVRRSEHIHLVRERTVGEGDLVGGERVT
jgi:hypothetical protein